MSPRLRLATVWLTGCSGCHMALLDLDDWLFELARFAEIVYSPIANDRKTFPTDVDVTLVEGAVATTANLELARTLRRCSHVVVSFGDCAVSGNVPALRNLFAREAVLDRAYGELADGCARRLSARSMQPCQQLLERVLPLHAVIDVDRFVPGCPPPVGCIRALLEGLRRGGGAAP